MFDAKIVAACIAARAAYERVKGHVDPAEFTPTGRFWWGLVEDWYSRDPSASGIDAGLLRDRAERAAGRNASMALDWYDALQHGICPSPDNVAWEVLELKRIVKWRELAAAMEAEWDREAISRLVEEHRELMQATSLSRRSNIDWGADLDTLSAEVGAGKRIRLWPEKLQEKTGGALPGDHIVAFGRPEVGKTLFSVNMVGGWLRDGHRVLYVGNEDNINKIKDRVRQNLSGMTKAEVEKWTDEANARCRRKGWDHFRALHMFPGSASEIAEIIEETKPQCLVVDQLRNLHTPSGKGGTKAQRLDDVACDVRQLGARYGTVVLSVGQANAGEHGRPKVWLDLDDFDESRTGVPGQADLMVGIGMDATLDAHNQRAFSLPKNKLSGDHEGFIVNVDKYRSKIQ
jgi:archaellum biogenesis ATPase FlaH